MMVIMAECCRLIALILLRNDKNYLKCAIKPHKYLHLKISLIRKTCLLGMHAVDSDWSWYDQWCCYET